MEAVVTTGAIRHYVQSYGQNVTTNKPTPSFLQALPVAQPTVSEY